METRAFGKTDLSCSAIGFGTWALSTTQYGDIDVAAATRAVGMALDHGITLFDTAESYGPYISEELLSRGLGERRKDIVLVTKVGFEFHEGEMSNNHIARRNASAENVIAHAEGCLRRMNTDYIDLLLIHWPDHDTPHEDTMSGLEALKTAGKIRHYGVSNYTVPMLEACQRHGHLTANQVGYNLFDRRMEAAVLPYCQREGIGFMAYGSLAYGLLTGAMSPETQFVDWDWRAGGMAFGLPLFQRENFLKELRVVERLKVHRGG